MLDYSSKHYQRASLIEVTTCPGDGLVLSGNKAIILTTIVQGLCWYLASLGHDKLTHWLPEDFYKVLHR